MYNLKVFCVYLEKKFIKNDQNITIDFVDIF